MATPSLTLDNIQQYISDVTYAALEKVCDDDTLQALSKPQGCNIEVEGKPSNVRMGWHRDQDDQITGLFLRIYNARQIEAYTLRVNSYDNLTVTGIHTTLASNRLIHVSKAGQIFACLSGDSHVEDIQFEVEDLKTPEQIQAFFQKSPDMLPSPLREQLFPSTPPKPLKKPVSQDGPSNFFIATVLLGILCAAYVAKQYFGKTKQ